MKKQVEYTNTKLHGLTHPYFLFASKATETTFSLAQKIAPSNSRVLIYGAKGTGKSNLATQIFRNSHRHDSPFEFINCSQLSLQNEQEQYNTFFGARKNHKLGVKSDIEGIFELANNGTVILQEVGYLSLKMQENIFQMIQLGQICPYGTEQVKAVDVRILSTTSQKIDELVEQHLFNEDLYYKLNSINIHLPPLSSRKEDIFSIAQYFFKQCIAESKKIITFIEPKVFYILKHYNWPGNVTELFNVIQRAVCNCNESTLRIHHISIHNFEDERDLSEGKNMNITNLHDALSDFKKKYIYKSLMLNNWNHTKTAKILDIQRSYLSKLVKVYNLKSGSLQTIDVAITENRTSNKEVEQADINEIKQQLSSLENKQNPEELLKE